MDPISASETQGQEGDGILPGRTFRIFLSSTFTDLVEERNALSRFVFPRLRATCEKAGYKFEAVDLRWGVREEATTDQKAVRICLDEIARCQKVSPKPNFVLLLGDRYGWRPLPYIISSGDMESLRPHFDATASALIFGSAGKGWYRLDENALPPEWVLQPRRGLYEVFAAWEPIETRLREAIVGAARSAGLSPEKRELLGASATELEIVRGVLDRLDSHEHVSAFFREIRNLREVDFKEIGADGLLDARASGPDGGTPPTWDEDAWNRLQKLKSEIEKRLGDRIYRYETIWKSGGIDYAGMGGEPGFREGTLCHEVFTRLTEVITSQIETLEAQDRDGLEEEIKGHANIARRLTRGFSGRAPELERIARHLKVHSPRPLVVSGPSGSGKSALMARSAKDARTAHPGAVVIQRFIGMVVGTTEVRSLLESLCRELSRAYSGQVEFAGSYQKLVEEFENLLAKASAQRPAILFLDALDQLGHLDQGRTLAWLPHSLPQHARLVVSTVPDEEYKCFPELEKRCGPEDMLEIGDLAAGNAGEALDAWLSTANPPRRVTPEQRSAILMGFRGCGLPLYLRLAFEQANRWRSYDAVPSGSLPADVPGMIRGLYRGLGRDHGRQLASRALGYLASARYGLSDDEMLSLLWRDPKVREEFEEARHHNLPEDDAGLPPIVWSRLYFDLEPYLAQREVFGASVFNFFHRQLAAVAREMTEEQGLNGALADYFVSRWRTPDTHALLELVGQLVASGRADQARELVVDFDWCAKKLVATDIHVLLMDYREIGVQTAEAAGRIEKALRMSSHVLAVRPFELAGHQIGRLHRFANESIRRHVTEARACIQGPALVPRGGSGLTGPDEALLLTINAHDSSFSFVVSDDGQRLISGGADKLVKVWSTSTGRLLSKLPGLQKAIKALCCMPDGTIIIAARNPGLLDRTEGVLQAWNSKTGEVLWNRKSEVSHLSPLGDGKRFVALSTQGIQVWDIARAKAVRCFSQGVGFQNALTMTPDHRLCIYIFKRREAPSGEPSTIIIQELESGVVRQRIPIGDSRGSLAATPDGKRLICGSNFKTLIVYDLETGHELKRMTAGTRKERAIGYGTMYDSIQVLRDGRTCIAGCGGPFGGSIHIWDLDRGNLTRILRGHSRGVTMVRVFNDDARLASASSDGTIKIWELNLAETVEMEEHPGPIEDVAITRDGTLVATGSNGDDSIKLWNHETGAHLRTMDHFNGSIAPLAFNPNGKMLVSGPIRICFWNIESGELLWEWNDFDWRGHRVKFLSDDAVIVGGYSGAVAYDSGSRRVLFRIPIQLGSNVTSETICVSPDGFKVLIACSVNSIRIGSSQGSPCLWVYDLKRRRPMHLFLDENADVVAIAPDSRVAATGSYKSISWWDLASGTMLRSTPVEGGVKKLAFSQCGGFTISISKATGRLELWDTMSGNWLSCFTGDADFSCLAAPLWGPERLVASDQSGRLHMFDLVLPPRRPSRAKIEGAEDRGTSSNIPKVLRDLEQKIDSALAQESYDEAKKLLRYAAWIHEVCGELVPAVETRRREQEICRLSEDVEGAAYCLCHQAILLSKSGRAREFKAAVLEMRALAEGQDYLESLEKSLEREVGLAPLMADSENNRELVAEASQQFPARGMYWIFWVAATLGFFAWAIRGLLYGVGWTETILNFGIALWVGWLKVIRRRRNETRP